MTEMGTLGLTRRGLETGLRLGYRESNPRGNGEPQVGRTSRDTAPDLDPTDEREQETEPCQTGLRLRRES